MIEDKGQVRVLKRTGKKVTLTGEMLFVGHERWIYEVVQGNGLKTWEYRDELGQILGDKMTYYRK